MSNVQSNVWFKFNLLWWGSPKPHVENAYEGDSGYTGVNLSNICGAKVAPAQVIFNVINNNSIWQEYAQIWCHVQKLYP